MAYIYFIYFKNIHKIYTKYSTTKFFSRTQCFTNLLLWTNKKLLSHRDHKIGSKNVNHVFVLLGHLSSLVGGMMNKAKIWLDLPLQIYWKRLYSTFFLRYLHVQCLQCTCTRISSSNKPREKIVTEIDWNLWYAIFSTACSIVYKYCTWPISKHLYLGIFKDPLDTKHKIFKNRLNS